MDRSKTREFLRKAYASIAQSESSCGCSCGTGAASDLASAIGYSVEEIKKVPDGSNLGLGCGNPSALAGLARGEVVLDLGSGAGFDCFLASSRVGREGHVIGVDMTPEMVEKARANAVKHGDVNVEFRLGEIENLPVADSSIDVVISNCVLNLSLDKEKVFREIVRVLKPGGRVALSDIALLRELPGKWLDSIEAYAGCISGAVLIDDYRRIVEASGLSDISVEVHRASYCIDADTTDPLGRAIMDNLEPGNSLDDFIASVNIKAVK